MHLFSGPEPVKQRLKVPLLSWLTSIGSRCSCRAASMVIMIFPSLTGRYGLLTQSGMQALKQERTRRTREGAPASILAETEDALVGFFIEGCRFEMQAGHMERAVASIQAALENTCFAPSIPVGMLSCAVQLMLCSHLLHCNMLCCAVLCCAVPSCRVLRCAVLCCDVLCCAEMCCAVPCCAVLSHTVLCCAVLCCAALRCAALRCDAVLLLCLCSNCTMLHAWLCCLVLSIVYLVSVGDTNYWVH